jgi:hypothetical protein
VQYPVNTGSINPRTLYQYGYKNKEVHSDNFLCSSLNSSHRCSNVLLSFSVCLRLQVNPQNKSEFSGISPERAFADFVFANLVLHLVVMNFIG